MWDTWCRKPPWWTHSSPARKSSRRPSDANRFLAKEKEESVLPETFEAYYLFKELSATGSFTPPPSPTFEFQPSDISLQSPSSPMVQVISPSDIFPPPSPGSSATSAIPSTVFPDTHSLSRLVHFILHCASEHLWLDFTGISPWKRISSPLHLSEYLWHYQRKNFPQAVCQRRVSKLFRIGSIIAMIQPSYKAFAAQLRKANEIQGDPKRL